MVTCALKKIPRVFARKLGEQAKLATNACWNWFGIANAALGKGKGINFLIWDNTPFCTLLFIDFNNQKKGYGAALLSHWEKDMKNNGYGMVLTSTQVDEEAQHFYRKQGYKDCGGMVMNLPSFEQAMELLLCKPL